MVTENTWHGSHMCMWFDFARVCNAVHITTDLSTQDLTIPFLQRGRVMKPLVVYEIKKVILATINASLVEGYYVVVGSACAM